jgi:hypothetical protein
VDVEIRPEPEERDVVLAAVDALLSAGGEPPAYRSAWRQAGVLENLADGPDRGDAREE